MTSAVANLVKASGIMSLVGQCSRLDVPCTNSLWRREALTAKYLVRQLAPHRAMARAAALSIFYLVHSMCMPKSKMSRRNPSITCQPSVPEYNSASAVDNVATDCRLERQVMTLPPQSTMSPL